MLMVTNNLESLVELPQASVDLKWFVLLTEPNGEARAERRLKALGFEPYVPQELRIKTRHHHTMFGSWREAVEVTTPIFRGYLFLPLNLAWSFGPLYSVPGLRQNGHPFLRVNEHPVVLSDAVMDRIKQIEAALRDPDVPGLPYKVGDQVQITEGAFLDLLAKITQLDSANRIEAEIDIFGRKTRVKFAAKQIAPMQ